MKLGRSHEYVDHFHVDVFSGKERSYFRGLVLIREDEEGEEWTIVDDSGVLGERDERFGENLPLREASGGMGAFGETRRHCSTSASRSRLWPSTKARASPASRLFWSPPAPRRRSTRPSPSASAPTRSWQSPTPARRCSRPTSRPTASNASSASGVGSFELADSLGRSPAMIFQFVHDSIDFDPKWGAFKGSLGTLWERKGTSWEQAWLLRDLLVAAGVDARFEWGEIQISTELLTNITGLDDPFRAGDLLTTAGFPIVLLVQGSQVIGARMSHAWVKAFIDYIPDRGVTPGSGDIWIRIDPSLKRFSYTAGLQIHDEVAFSLSHYLLSGTELSPQRTHQEALWAYIRANNINCTTLEQLKKAESVIAERFPFLPGTLRGKILQVGGEAAVVPDAFKEKLRLEVRTEAGSSLLSWESFVSDLFGQRVALVYEGATADDQAALDGNGGVFETPPFLVDLKPVVRVGGGIQASGSAIGSAQGVQIFVTLTPVNGAADVFVHDGFAGEPNVLVTDFGRLPHSLLNGYQAALLAAREAGDETEEGLATLQMIGATYMHDLGRDLEDLTGWNWHRLLRVVTEGLISQAGTVTTSVAGTPIGFTRAERFVDIAGITLGLFHTEGETSFLKPTLELAGAQGSFLEGEVFNQVLERQGIAAVSALTRAQREGQSLTQVDSSNVDAVLAGVDLGEDIEDQVRSAVASSKIAWVSENPIDVNLWRGTGYILEDPTTGAAAYLISGGFAGGADTGPLKEFLATLGEEPWLTEGPFGEVMGFLSSLLDDGPPDTDGPSTLQSDPINMSTGNLWQPNVDLTFPVRGFPIIWSRSYNSQGTYVGPLGHGWTFSYGEQLERQLDGSILYRDEDGTEHLFLADGNDGFVAPPGKHVTLSESPAGFELHTKEGFTNRFDPHGKLISIADHNGQTVILNYDGDGNLATITGPAGRTVLALTTLNGLIIQVEDLSGRRVQYLYSGSDLVGVIDTEGETWSYGYDNHHNMTSCSDPLGHTNTFAYDTLDRCVQHVDPLGHTEQFSFSSLGERAVLTDRRGSSAYFEFDDRGRATLAVNPLGAVSRSTWDSDNNRTSTTDPRGGVTTRTFDGRGNLLTETDPLQHTTTYTYDPVTDKVLTFTDGNGLTVTNAFDEFGNLTEMRLNTSTETHVNSFDYDAQGQLIEFQTSGGNLIQMAWDPIKGTPVAFSNSLQNKTTLTTNDAGQMVRMEDSDNNVTLFEWNSKDQLLSVTDTLANVSTFTYDKAGRQTESTNQQGTNRRYYDALGRVIAMTDALGQTTHLEYDAQGNNVAQVDARGNRTTFTYDALGRVAAVVDALGNVWSYDYCAELGSSPASGCSGGNCQSNGSGAGSFCSLTDPLGNTMRQEHDELGRVVRVIDPLNNVTEIEYDSLSRQVAVTDPLGRTVRKEYDDLGKLTAVVDAAGGRTEYTYDIAGNLINRKDAEQRNWPRTYDELNRLKTKSDPLGNTAQFFYDALGNLIRMIKPDAEEITYDYENGRLTAINLPGNTTETFGYDASGNQISVANSEMSLSIILDEFYRQTQITNHTLNQSIDYEFDGNGNVARMTGPLGTVDYYYDAQNRLVEQRDPATGTYRYEYDALGRRTGIQYPNGLVTEFTYDAALRLESVVTRNRVGEIVDGYSYTYNTVGNRATMRSLHDGLLDQYEYDDLDRLKRWQRGADRFEEYTYDMVGNRLTLVDESKTKTYSYDLANRLFSEVHELNGGNSVTTSYEWDDNGNMISRTTGSVTTTYQWDALNRLVQVDGPSGLHSYGYDPNGIRVRQTDNGNTKRFLHAGEDIVGVFADGSLETYYAHGPGIDEPLAQVNAEGTNFMHRDGLMSVTALSSPEGQMTGLRSYGAYGGLENSSGVASRYGYTGRDLDPTAMTYHRARYYQPETGRFASMDSYEGSLQNPASQHGYAYAQNNPINMVDPTGRVALAVILVLLALNALVVGVLYYYYNPYRLPGEGWSDCMKRSFRELYDATLHVLQWFWGMIKDFWVVKYFPIWYPIWYFGKYILAVVSALINAFIQWVLGKGKFWRTVFSTLSRLIKFVLGNLRKLSLLKYPGVAIVGFLLGYAGMSAIRCIMPPAPAET